MHKIVLFHSTSTGKAIAQACLENPTVAHYLPDFATVPLTDYWALECIPRHHPVLVSIVEAAIQAEYDHASSFEVVEIDHPDYHIIRDESTKRERIWSQADLVTNAAEFNGEMFV